MSTWTSPYIEIVAAAESDPKGIVESVIAEPGNDFAQLYDQAAGSWTGTLRALVYLRSLSLHLAQVTKCRLHTAQYVLTTDPDMIEKVGMHDNPDCARCRGSVDQAKAFARDHPDKPLLVGRIYWIKEPS